MRESYRSFADRVVRGYDIIFVARNTIADCSEAEVERCMKAAAASCELLAKH
jgi:ribonuclease P protein component